MLVADPDSRPTIEDVLTSPWIRGCSQRRKITKVNGEDCAYNGYFYIKNNQVCYAPDAQRTFENVIDVDWRHPTPIDYTNDKTQITDGNSKSSRRKKAVIVYRNEDGITRTAILKFKNKWDTRSFIFEDYVAAQKAVDTPNRSEVTPKIPICYNCYYEGEKYGCNVCGVKTDNGKPWQEKPLMWCPVCSYTNERNTNCENCNTKGESLKPVRRRRMAIREFSSRRDSPVLVRLLEDIVAANRRA